jgi:DNA-binding transcriptional LysR family regulator
MQIESLEACFRTGQTVQRADTLVVGGSNTLSTTVLPEAIVAFKRTHPDVVLELETRYSRIIEDDISNARIDVGLITAPSDQANCIYEPYKKHEATAFVAPDHPLSAKTLTLAELTRCPLIVRRGSANILELEKQGFHLNLILQCDAPEAVKAAVKRGIGVGILFGSRVGVEISTGELCQVHVPELKDIVTRSFIIYNRHRSLSASAEDFIATLRGIKDQLP